MDQGFVLCSFHHVSSLLFLNSNHLYFLLLLIQQVYSPLDGYQNNWIRVAPYTQHGAPARGATVKLLLDNGVQQMKVLKMLMGVWTLTRIYLYPIL